MTSKKTTRKTLSPEERAQLRIDRIALRELRTNLKQITECYIRVSFGPDSETYIKANKGHIIKLAREVGASAFSVTVSNGEAFIIVPSTL